MKIHTNNSRVVDGLVSRNEKLEARVKELEALCKECSDHLDENEWRSIPADSYLHRDLKKKGKGL